MRKRWPAIEPHWRVLYHSGQVGEPLTRRESLSLSRLFRRLSRDFNPSVAIIKVTPK